MTALKLTDLGIEVDREELLEQAAQLVAAQVLSDTGMYDREPEDDGDQEALPDITFGAALQARVEEKIRAAVDTVAAAHVLPKIEEVIENFCLQKTNEWGDKKGEPLTFTEYLVERAINWIQEPVNHQGKTKGEDSYQFRAQTSRIAYLIDKHLQYHIERAMTDALKDANSAIAEGLNGAVRTALSNVSVKVETRVSRK